MKITYLGTGGAEGIPGVFCECPACRKSRELGGRNIKTRSCTLVNDVLIDISPDIFSQCTTNHLNLSEISNILMTHSHADHLNTLAIRHRMQEAASVPGPGQEKTLKMYGNSQVYQVIMKALEGENRIDHSRMKYRELHAFEHITAGTLDVVSLKANHKKDEECLIYALSDGTGSLLYANDTGEVPEETIAHIREKGLRFDAVSMDTGRGTLPGDGHMGLMENIAFRERLKEIGAAGEHTRFFLNHFCHMCGLTHEEYQELAGAHGFTLTYDGMTLVI